LGVAAKQMTIDEFFAWQLQQEDRYELVDGYPVEMMSVRQSGDTILNSAEQFRPLIEISIAGLSIVSPSFRIIKLL
jgi:hypothetical protein